MKPKKIRLQDWTAVDQELGLPNDNQICEVAKAINSLHIKSHNTHRHSRNAYRELGLKGERHVARHLGLPMDLSLKPGGNNRANLRLPNGIEVDVMTRSVRRDGTLPDMMMKTDEKELPGDRAIILVVNHGDEYEMEILGWAWESTLRKQQVREINKHDQWVLTPNQLRPLTELIDQANVA